MLAPAATLLARAMKQRAHESNMSGSSSDVCMHSLMHNKSASTDEMLERAMALSQHQNACYGASLQNQLSNCSAAPAPGCGSTASYPMAQASMQQSNALLPTMSLHATSQGDPSPMFYFGPPLRHQPCPLPIHREALSQRKLMAPLHKGLVPASSSCDGASMHEPLTGQGLETAMAAAPEKDDPLPMITMIRGRFYKPQSVPSKRKSISSAYKRKSHMLNTYELARDPPYIPAGLGRTRSRPGITMPGEEPSEPAHTSAEARQRAEGREVERTLSLFTKEMAQHILPFSDAERSQMRTETEDELSERVRSFLNTKSHHLASMSNARRALLSLHDYASSVGVTLHNFKASIGMISAFLSSQQARTMAASRLQGLKWAQFNYSIAIDADAPALKSFSESHSDGSNHATTMPISIVCHLAVIASDKSQHAYVRAVAAGIHLMVAASLRWADAQRTKWKLMNNCIEGCGQTKVGFQYWWGERKDLLDGDSWLRPLKASYRDLSHPPDYIFRRAEFERGHAGDPNYFTKWIDAPAVKQHVIEAFIHTLMLPPLSLTREEAMKYVRLHGARRVYPTLARFMSGTLNLSFEDRQELGRWAPVLADGDRAARRAAMANRYSTDAERARCVKTRARVAEAARALIRDHGWKELPIEGGGYESFIAEDIPIEEPEPDLSSDESDTEVA